jgi:nitrite reductase (NADH) small subunit
MPGEMLTRTAEYAIGPMAQIPRGEGRNFEVGGRLLAVFRTHQDEVFASQAECPHRQGPLADGMMGGATIMCPLHDRTYDLRTGKALAGECDIAVYPVRKSDGGMLLVEMWE